MKKSFYEEKRRNKCYKEKLDEELLSYLPKFSFNNNSENLFKFESLKFVDDNHKSNASCGRKPTEILPPQISNLSELFSESSDSKINKYRKHLLEIIL